MKKMMVLAALFAAVAPGCKKKRPEEGTGGPVAGAPPAGSAETGSAGSAAAAAPMSGDDLVKAFDKCWGYFNDSKWDDFKTCYSPEAVLETPGSGKPAATGIDAILADVKLNKDTFPDLKGERLFVLVDNHDLIAISLVTGTNLGTMKTPAGELPATKNKTGYVLAQVLELEPNGKAKHEWEFYDAATLLGQIKPDPKHPVRATTDKLGLPTEVVISKDDAKEKANEEIAKKSAEVFSKHDAKAFGDLLADDVVWSDISQAKDDDKKQTVAGAQAFWKGFSDAKITVDSAWSGGDYVAVSGVIEGTNDGDLPEMGIKKTGKAISLPRLVVMKIDNGKIKRAWEFDQSLALISQLGLMIGNSTAPATK